MLCRPSSSSLPLALFLIQSFFYVDHGEIVRQLTLRNYVRFFTDAAFVPVFLRTCLLCLGVAAISVAFAYPVAYLLAQPARPAEIRADARLRHPADDELHHQDLRDPRHPRRQRLPQPDSPLPRHHRPAADLPHLQSPGRPPDALGDPPALRDPADLHRARAHPAEHPRRLRRPRRLVLPDVPLGDLAAQPAGHDRRRRPSPSCSRSAIS